MHRRLKISVSSKKHDDDSDSPNQQESSDTTNRRNNMINTSRKFVLKSSSIVTLVIAAVTATFSSVSHFPYFSMIYFNKPFVDRYSRSSNDKIFKEDNILSDENLSIATTEATLKTNSTGTVIPLSEKKESTTKTKIETTPATNTNTDTIIPSHHNLTSNNSHVRVAYMISISNCPDLNSSNASIIDGPAVLAHSIRRLESRYPNYHLVALIHPRATNCTQHFHHNPLFGYDRAIIRDLGFNRSNINDRRKYGSKYIDWQGCCGADEFLKLEAYTFENEYDVVIHMDTDLLILKPMDDIIDTLVTSSVPINLRTFNQQNTKESNSSHLDSISFVYTRDYIQMSKLTTDPTKYAVQGGFFAIRPNQFVYREMIEIIYKGEFIPQTGWNQEGYGGYYGSAQVQGFLSYMYGSVLPSSSMLWKESRSMELHPCYYNSMIIGSPYTEDGICRYDSNLTINTTTTTNNVSSCPDCESVTWSELHSAHYTVCYKPWACPLLKRFGPQCKLAHREWFLTRHELEQEVWNQSTSRNPDGGWNTNVNIGYCRGRRDYVPMHLPHSGG